MFRWLLILFGIKAFAASQPADYFSIAGGIFSVTKDKWRTAEFEAEYKFHIRALTSPLKELDFRPLVGLMGTLKGSIYLYAGINFDLLFAEHLLISPGFAAGYYSKGHGRNLGYPLEFRSGIELGWQCDDLRRFGVHFYHLSNASIGKKNPGEESLVFYYDIPINRGFPYK